MESQATGAGRTYQAPLIMYVGHLADLTQVIDPCDDPNLLKEVGAIDGLTCSGVDLGSV